MPKEVMDDLDEIGVPLVDADQFIVNKKKTPITRIRTWLIGAVNWITNGMLRQSAGTSVVGRSAGTTGDVADITASSNDTFLQRVAGALTWAGLTIGMVADGLLTRAKLANATGQSVIGRATSGTGAVADIAAGTDNRVLGQSGGVLSFLRATLAMLADGTALSVIGRSANSTGVYADISTTNGSAAVLRESGGTIGFGTVATAGIANSAVTPAKLAAHPAAAMYVNAAQSLADSSTTTLNFDTSEFAYGGSNAPTVVLASDRIDIVLAGLYRISLRVGYDAISTTGFLDIIIRVDGVDVAETRLPNAGANGTTAECSILVPLAAAAQVTAQVFHTNGGARNTNTEAKRRPRLSVEYVGPTA